MGLTPRKVCCLNLTAVLLYDNDPKLLDIDTKINLKNWHQKLLCWFWRGLKMTLSLIYSSGSYNFNIGSTALTRQDSSRPAPDNAVNPGTFCCSGKWNMGMEHYLEWEPRHPVHAWPWPVDFRGGGRQDWALDLPASSHWTQTFYIHCKILA